MDGLVSFLLAIVGLGMLILIHELGHYFMARKAGMRVEVFSIGFGLPIFSFMHRGVKINICWIPVGGYVKIAGMEKGSKAPPEESFFAKPPISRILVSLCGPLANVLFALVAFSIIWVQGGREKTYGDVSSRVGWVDPQSTLYAKGVRPGDKIVSYNGVPVRGAKDHFYAAMTGGPQLQVEVEKNTGSATFTITPYQHPQAIEEGILSTGVLAPANFLILGSSAEHAQMQPSDRLVWIDGQPLFSSTQLSMVLNNGCQYMTILRDGAYKNVLVPRVLVGELNIPQEVKGELSDWQYEDRLLSTKTNELWFIPYNLTSKNVVESKLSFIDSEHSHTKEGDSLKVGDTIVAVAGIPVHTAPELLQALQEKKVLVAIERGIPKLLSLQQADTLLLSASRSSDLAKIVQSIGTPSQINECGQYVLLQPIVPKTRKAMLEAMGKRTEEMTKEELKAVQSVEDPATRAALEQSIKLRDRQLMLGLVGVHDEVVLYNPNPLQICSSVAHEIYQTIAALFGGYLSPRWMSGPIGILHVIQQQWSVGFKEALFWLGTISLNLAILNLLPLPVLDGGYILLSIFEMITGVKFKIETIEKIVLPFAILLIILLIYLSYHDVIRILSRLVSSWSG
jgi:regulator of sigma E protease